jgi:hypothetical protein
MQRVYVTVDKVSAAGWAGATDGTTLGAPAYQEEAEDA